MVANAAQVQCRPCGNASPPGRGPRPIPSRIRPRGRAFGTRPASSARASAAGSRARFGAYCGSGNPSHTAGASAASEIPAGLGNACLRALGAAVRTLFDSERIRFAAGRRSARADRDQRALAQCRSAGRTGLPGVPTERPRRRPRKLPAGARARTDQPRHAARPARPGGFGEPLENPHRNPAGGRASAFLARQSVCAAVALDRSPVGLFQGLLGRSGKCRLRLQSRREPRSTAPGKACARVLPASARFDRQARGELRPRPGAAARSGAEQIARLMNSPRLSAQTVSPQAKRHIGQILISQGILTEDQLRIALLEQLKTHQPVGKLLVNLGFVSEATLRDALSEKLGLQSVDLTQIVVDSMALKLVPREFSKRHTVFPVALDREARKLIIAIADTNNIVALDQVRAQLRGEFALETRLAGESEIGRAIDQYYGHDFSIDGILHEIETGEIDYQSLQASGDAYSQPVVRLISALFADAVEPAASDIHFEPEQSFLSTL